MAGLGDWARRRSGQPQPQATAAPRMPAAAPALPIPPPGYAWAVSNGQYVCVPLIQPQTAPQLVAPVRQPAGVVPFSPQPLTSPGFPGQPSSRAETCVLVKPGDKDTYADLLDTLPSMAPDISTGYDAMSGRPSPTTLAEIKGCAEAFGDQTAPHPDAPLRAFPEGAQLVRGSTPLKGN